MMHELANLKFKSNTHYWLPVRYSN